MPSSSGRSYWASNKSHWYHFLLDSSSVQSNSFNPQNRLPDRVHTIGVCIFQKGKRSFLQLQNLLKVTEEADGKTHMKVLLETKSTFDILTIPQQPGFSECYHQRFVVGRKFTYRAASSVHKSLSSFSKLVETPTKTPPRSFPGYLPCQLN